MVEALLQGLVKAGILEAEDANRLILEAVASSDASPHPKGPV